MSRTVLQIPVNPQVRKRAEREAERQGFSSLQELIRLLMRKVADRELSIKVEEPAIQLSKRAVRRYNKILDDIEKGKNIYHAKDVNDLMRKLNEN